MELHEALTQISDIRQQMIRTTVFRGYRSATVAFSGAVAVAAALYQSAFLGDIASHVQPYLFLWVSAAALSAMVAGVEMYIRCRRLRSPLQVQMTLFAVEQFLPSLVSGAALTYVLFHWAPQAMWMLPGLWAILFALGGYASCRFLPRAMFWASCFYLTAGLACLRYAQGPNAFSPWAMGLTFGCGQLLTAVILYWTLERKHVAA